MAEHAEDVLVELRRRLRDDLGYSITAYVDRDGDARIDGYADAVEEILSTLRDMGLLPALNDGSPDG